MLTKPGLTPNTAGEQFENWFGRVPSAARLCVLCHSDADGLAAGAILHRGLKRAGRDVETIVTGKFENGWSETVRDRVKAKEPGALIVVILACRRGRS
jgi:single-stranded DNA-specific DHH superfamily exonuclease